MGFFRECSSVNYIFSEIKKFDLQKWFSVAHVYIPSKCLERQKWFSANDILLCSQKVFCNDEKLKLAHVVYYIYNKLFRSGFADEIRDLQHVKYIHKPKYYILIIKFYTIISKTIRACCKFNIVFRRTISKTYPLCNLHRYTVHHLRIKHT